MAYKRPPRVRTKTKFKWNIDAFKQIRYSPEVKGALDEIVGDILDITGRDHYVGQVSDGKSRARGGVVTADFDGVLDNEQNQTLLRAIEGVS